MNGVLSTGKNGWEKNNPTVGRRVRLNWADIQPDDKDHFDWTLADAEVDKAIDSGREIGMSFYMCGDEAIPQWVTAKRYNVSAPNSGAHVIVLPWEIQGPIVSFNKAVAKRYEGDLDYLPMSGLGTFSTESIICEQPSDIGMDESVALDKWQKCCVAIVDAYAKLSDTPFIFTAAPPFKTSKAKTALSDLVNNKCEQYPDRFGIMNCGLNAETTRDYLPADLIYQHRDTNPVGFQMVWCACDDPNNRMKGTLEECMENGYNLGAHWFEIYPKDADDPNSRDAIIAMNKKLNS